MESPTTRQAKNLALFNKLVLKLGLTEIGRRMPKRLTASTVFGWKDKGPPDWRMRDLEAIDRDLARQEGKRPREARRKKAH